MKDIASVLQYKNISDSTLNRLARKLVVSTAAETETCDEYITTLSFTCVIEFRATFDCSDTLPAKTAVKRAKHCTTMRYQ